MPYKPMKPCKHPGCPKLTSGKYCEVHAPLHVHDRAYAYERGYDSRWQKARGEFLRAHPVCVECYRQRKITHATVVDHIIPHRGDKTLFWDRSNWQALCKRCHDKKTRTQDEIPVYHY